MKNLSSTQSKNVTPQVMGLPSHLQRNWSCAPGCATDWDAVVKRVGCHDRINDLALPGLTEALHDWLCTELNCFAVALYLHGFLWLDTHIYIDTYYPASLRLAKTSLEMAVASMLKCSMRWLDFLGGARPESFAGGRVPLPL